MSKSYIILILLVLTSCASFKKLPTETHYPFLYYFDEEFKNDTVYFHLENPLNCPVNIKLVPDTLNPNLEQLFGHITLSELKDTILKINYPNVHQTSNTRYIVRYGDPNKKIEKSSIAFPFPKGKNYKIIQAYHGRFSHNSISSQYAIDFNLKIGDTITSVDNGFVVGLVEDYQDYGTSKQWREHDKSNFITIYHPHSGLFSQYVHLNHHGALVKLGDYVQQGQEIGISGMTGYTTTPHLHFNVKIPSEEHGLISTDIEFMNGIKGKDLKANDRVTY